MVAIWSAASPRSWRPTSRTLGALFAGSAVMFSAAVLQGGPLIRDGHRVQPATEPQTANNATPAVPDAGSSSSTAPASAPGQAVPWTPNATPGWSTPLRDLPVHRAPVQPAPQHNAAPTAAQHGGQNAAGSADAPFQTRPAEQPQHGLLGDVFGYLGFKTNKFSL